MPQTAILEKKPKNIAKVSQFFIECANYVTIFSSKHLKELIYITWKPFQAFFVDVLLSA